MKKLSQKLKNRFKFKKNMKFPKSTRIFIRRRKAQIRRQFFDAKKQEELIKEIHDKFNTKK